MISYRQNTAVAINPEPACGRCHGTELIPWEGIYAPRGSGKKLDPCLRCRPGQFCIEIGLHAAGSMFLGIA